MVLLRDDAQQTQSGGDSRLVDRRHRHLHYPIETLKMAARSIQGGTKAIIPAGGGDIAVVDLHWMDQGTVGMPVYAHPPPPQDDAALRRRTLLARECRDDRLLRAVGGLDHHQHHHHHDPVDLRMRLQGGVADSRLGAV